MVNVIIWFVSDRVPDWYWYVIGFGVGIFFIVVISMISLTYYLWRERHPLILQIARYIQKPEGQGECTSYSFYTWEKVMFQVTQHCPAINIGLKAKKLSSLLVYIAFRFRLNRLL